MAKQEKNVKQQEKMPEAQTQIEPHNPNGTNKNGSDRDGVSQTLASRVGQQTLQRHSDIVSVQPSFLRMRQMMDDMDRVGAALGLPSLRRIGLPALFDLAPRALGEMQEQHASWSPQVELFERDGQLVVRADLPGLSKDDVQIDVEDDVLSLRGQRHSEHEERQQGFYRSERSYGSFQRSFRLPEGIRPDQVKASFENGVLEITIPTPQQSPPKSHRVEIG